jgi:hypothetical protein
MSEKLKVYGFKIGKRLIQIEAKTERNATIKLINQYWEMIDKAEIIELYGDCSPKVLALLPDWIKKLNEDEEK